MGCFENKKLHQDLDKANEEIEKLKKEKGDLHYKYKTLHTNYDTLQYENDGLKTENNELKTVIEQKGNLNQELARLTYQNNYLNHWIVILMQNLSVQQNYNNMLQFYYNNMKQYTPVNNNTNNWITILFSMESGQKIPISCSIDLSLDYTLMFLSMKMGDPNISIDNYNFIYNGININQYFKDKILIKNKFPPNQIATITVIKKSS